MEFLENKWKIYLFVKINVNSIIPLTNDSGDSIAKAGSAFGHKFLAIKVIHSTSIASEISRLFWLTNLCEHGCKTATTVLGMILYNNIITYIYKATKSGNPILRHSTITEEKVLEIS